MIYSYPRETVEFIPVNVTVDGDPVLTGVLLSVTPAGTRPTVWSTPVTLEGGIGVMVNALAVGRYSIFGKITDASPEIPVFACGQFDIT